MCWRFDSSKVIHFCIDLYKGRTRVLWVDSWSNGSSHENIFTLAASEADRLWAILVDSTMWNADDLSSENFSLKIRTKGFCLAANFDLYFAFKLKVLTEITASSPSLRVSSWDQLLVTLSKWCDLPSLARHHNCDHPHKEQETFWDLVYLKIGLFKQMLFADAHQWPVLFGNFLKVSNWKTQQRIEED